MHTKQNPSYVVFFCDFNFFVRPQMSDSILFQQHTNGTILQTELKNGYPEGSNPYFYAIRIVLFRFILGSMYFQQRRIKITSLNLNTKNVI